jgi:L-alanine-DL-glutamate epimerase-like enolase superfamily enzyme
VLWFEEPVWPPEDHAGLARVRAEGGVAIAAGENAASAMDIEHMLDAKAVDYIQPSVTKIGGVSELVRIMKSARQRGVKAVPHSPYFGPGFLATLHAVAAFEDETMIERYHCELGASPFGDAIDAREGKLRVPDGPGLGYDPDPRILERYRI